MTYRFGPFVADRTAYRVAEGGRALELTPKLLDLLFYFLERPATLVTKEELLEGVWPAANVTENALAQAISDLREVLNDTANSPTYIRTVARRGYRFVAPVETAESRATGADQDPNAIAVLDFVNVSGDPEIAWLGAGIAETVTSDLAALDRFHVVDRWRVVTGVRGTNSSLRDVGATVGARLLVTGSYQRSGTSVRITARIVDLTKGEAIADAKVDGALADIFSLQDQIVAAFAKELGVAAQTPPARLAARETSNLDAYRAFVEGTLKLETLDTAQARESVADFERAISLDPRYATAYTGLANAQFVAYEMTRLSASPDQRALESGIARARDALRLDDRLAEAHGALSFLLVSAGMVKDARAAAERAVSLEPENWRHHYRLGHASWGETRLRAFARAVELYPEISYAPLGMAMVHIARGKLDLAEAIVERGVADQDRRQTARQRFPPVGFHWMLGLLKRAQHDARGAADEFEKELAQADLRRLYGPEYTAAALVAQGQLALENREPARAKPFFQLAATRIEDYPLALIGLAAAASALGDGRDAEVARDRAHRRIAEFNGTGRKRESLLFAACDRAIHGEHDRAIESLTSLLAEDPQSHVGWTIPVEPFLAPLRVLPSFTGILARLAERSR